MLTLLELKGKVTQVGTYALCPGVSLGGDAWQLKPIQPIQPRQNPAAARDQQKPTARSLLWRVPPRQEKCAASGAKAATGKGTTGAKASYRGKGTTGAQAATGKGTTGAKAATGKGAASKRGSSSSRATGKGSKSSVKVAPIRSKGKDLVIVESPAKARTVGQILGDKYVVTASQGHVRDLPQWRFGVNIEQDFEPSYEVVKDKKDLVSQLKAAGDSANEIYFATDPDREGEAISWHLQEGGRVGRPSRAPEAGGLPRDHQGRGGGSLQPSPRNRHATGQRPAGPADPGPAGGLPDQPAALRKRVQRGVSAGRVQSVALGWWSTGSGKSRHSSRWSPGPSTHGCKRKGTRPNLRPSCIR